MPEHNNFKSKSQKTIEKALFYRRNEMASSAIKRFDKLIKNIQFYKIIKKDEILNGLLLSDAHLRKPKNRPNPIKS